MRSARVVPLIAGLGLSLLGCSGSGSGDPTTTPPVNTLDVETGTFEAPPGESLTCFYTSTTTEKELYITNATGQQGPGGHHITVYYTDTPKPVQHHICSDVEMLSWHQIAGADTNKEPIIHVPDGAGIKIPAGKQIVIQSHYINTSGAPETVNDTVSIDLVNASDVKQFLNFFAMVDAQFSLPPHMQSKSVTTCDVKDDLNTVILLGHMHEMGTHYTLERVDATGKSLETIYDQAWQPAYMSHPPIMNHTLDAPYVIKAGTRLRQTCEWNNTTANTVTFPTEMCVNFSFYFPDNGWIECDGVPQ
jgi:hypothetical protein